MIYTCTINPSLDYYIKVDDVILDKTNRVLKEEFRAGGKGVNVSIALNNMNIPSRCLGFLGGFTKDYYLDFLATYKNILPSFVGIKENTRINIKLVKNNTSFNAHGPMISTAEWERFINRTKQIDTRDFFVLSGNVQEELEDKVYILLEELSKRNVFIILDTNPSLMKRSLNLAPLLLAPSKEDLECIYNTKINNENELISLAKKLIEDGASNVLLSLDNEKIIYLGPNLYLSEGLNDFKKDDTTGSNDALVAGFISSILKGASSLDAYRYALASYHATRTNKQIADINIINEIYDKIKIIQN